MRHAWSLDRPRPVRVDTPEKEARLKEVLAHHDLAAIDTETTGKRTDTDVVVFWSVSTGEDRYFLERKHLDSFRSVLEDPYRTWIGSQVKFDVHMLANTGIDLRGALLCTLTADRLLDPAQPHGLKELYERFFQERIMSFGETFYPKDSTGKPKKPANKPMYRIMMEAFDADPDRVVDYATLDAWGVLRCLRRLETELRQVTTWAGNTLWDIFCWYESPFTRVLFEMERNGIALDTDYLAAAEPRIQQRQVEIERLVARRAGHIVNLDSPMQLVQFLNTELGLDPIKMTKGGEGKSAQPSTDKSVLQAYAEAGVQEAGWILEHRKLGKMLGTYVHGLQKRVDPNGRIHTTFNQHVADTARLSSTDPNLQNQVRSGSDYLDIRKAFVASAGCQLGVADYDQLEMYVLGHFSGDHGLLASARSGRDIHAALTELIYEEPYDEIVEAKEARNRSPRQKYLKELRDAEKAVSFGLVYGKAARAMSIDLGLPAKVREEYPEWSHEGVLDEAARRAQHIINLFFQKMPEAHRHIQEVHHRIGTARYVESFLGRRRYFPDTVSPEEYEEHEYQALRRGNPLCWCESCDNTRSAQRQGTNHEIQGTAADIVQLAMLRLHADQELRSLDFRMLLQVHDEVVFEAPTRNMPRVCELVQWHMEHPGLRLRVPLRAKPGVGSSWSEAKG